MRIRKKNLAQVRTRKSKIAKCEGERRGSKETHRRTDEVEADRPFPFLLNPAGVLHSSVLEQLSLLRSFFLSCLSPMLTEPWRPFPQTKVSLVSALQMHLLRKARWTADAATASLSLLLLPSQFFTSYLFLQFPPSIIVLPQKSNQKKWKIGYVCLVILFHVSFSYMSMFYFF